MRPCARSIAWRAESSVSGASDVSSATIWLRYGACAIAPRGAVSSTDDAAISRVDGSSVSATRARSRCAARSPRFEPSATYARSATCALHDDLRVGQWSVEQYVRLPDGDAHVRHVTQCEGVVGDRAGDLLEVVDRLAPRLRSDQLVQVAVVEHPGRIVG